MMKLFVAGLLIIGLILVNGCNKIEKQKEICELEKEYEHTAISPVNCECPAGYEFKTVSIGWGPCPEEGMSDCPASVLKCVKKS